LIRAKCIVVPKPFSEKEAGKPDRRKRQKPARQADPSRKKDKLGIIQKKIKMWTKEKRASGPEGPGRKFEGKTVIKKGSGI